MIYKRKSPRKSVSTENVEASKKETGKKPRENVQEEENSKENNKKHQRFWKIIRS